MADNRYIVRFQASLKNLKKGFAGVRKEGKQTSNNFKKISTTGTKAMTGLNTAVGGVNKGMSSLGISVKSLTALFTVAFARAVLNSADRIQKLSQRLGVSTEALSQLQFVGEQTGVSFETLTLSMQRATRRIAEAAQGTGEAKNAIAELGLSAVELNKLAPDQQLFALADAFQGVANQADKVRLAMKLFDSEGVALVQTLSLGREGMMQLMQTADQLGVTLTKENADKLAQVNDAFNKASTAIRGSFLEALVTLGPHLTDFGNFIASAIRGISKLISILAGAWKSAVKGAASLLVQFNAGLKTISIVLAREFSTAMINAEIGILRVRKAIKELLVAYRAMINAGRNNELGRILGISDDDLGITQKRLDIAIKGVEAIQGKITTLEAKRAQVGMMATQAIAGVGDDASSQIDGINAPEEPAETLPSTGDPSGGLDGLGGLGGQGGGTPPPALPSLTAVPEDKFEEELQRLTEQYNRRKITFEDFLRQVEDAEDQHNKKRGAGRDMLAKQGALAEQRLAESAINNTAVAVKTTLGLLAQRSKTAAKIQKTLDRVQKVFAIASAIRNTAVGVTKALELPFPANLAAAATTAAAGAVQIATIKSGGGAPQGIGTSLSQLGVSQPGGPNTGGFDTTFGDSLDAANGVQTIDLNISSDDSGIAKFLRVENSKLSRAGV